MGRGQFAGGVAWPALDGVTYAAGGAAATPATLAKPESSTPGASHEEIGRVERRNQTLKQMVNKVINKVIKETNAIRREQVVLHCPSV